MLGADRGLSYRGIAEAGARVNRVKHDSSLESAGMRPFIAHDLFSSGCTKIAFSSGFAHRRISLRGAMSLLLTSDRLGTHKIAYPQFGSKSV